jgi:hypothetical protein
MPPPALSAHAFNRALALVGSVKRLAHRLRVPVADLQAWLAGSDVPPFPVFLEAVDIILSPQEEDRFAAVRCVPAAEAETRL